MNTQQVDSNKINEIIKAFSEVVTHLGEKDGLSQGLLKELETFIDTLPKAIEADSFDDQLSPRTMSTITGALALVNLELTHISNTSQEYSDEQAGLIHTGVDYLLKNVVKVSPDGSYSIVGQKGSFKPF